MRRTLMLALLSSSPALGAELDEADVVRRFLAGPVGRTTLEAAEARARAERTGPPLLDNPVLEARHEDANGPGGATTDAIGGAMTIDLGLSSLAERGAARTRGEAAERWRAAVAFDAVCRLRQDSVDLWAASASAEVTRDAQVRLERLVETLGALAEAGEASGYDRDRAALAVASHGVTAAAAQGELDALRARLSAQLGEPVDDVTLTPIAPLPEPEPEAVVNPELAALRLERDAARKSEGAARRSALPDLAVFAASRWDSLPDGTGTEPGFEVGGGLEIPLFDTSRQEIRQAAARRHQTEAELARAEAEVAAAIESARRRAAVLEGSRPEPLDPNTIWEAATVRYAAGETSLEELLQTAEAVEAGRLAEIDGERRLRGARLDLACASGRFDEPSIQSVLEETLR